MKHELGTLVSAWRVFVDDETEQHTIHCPACNQTTGMELTDEHTAPTHAVLGDILIQTYSGECGCGQFRVEIWNDRENDDRYVAEYNNDDSHLDEYLPDNKFMLDVNIPDPGDVFRDILRKLYQLEPHLPGVISEPPQNPVQVVVHTGKMNNWKTIYGVRLNFMIYHMSDKQEWVTCKVTDSHGNAVYEQMSDGLTDDELEQESMKMARWTVIWNLTWLKQSSLYQYQIARTPRHLNLGSMVQFRHWYCNNNPPVLRTGEIVQIRHDIRQDVPVFNIKADDRIYNGIPHIHIVRKLTRPD